MFYFGSILNVFAFNFKIVQSNRLVLYVSRCLTPYETDEIIEKVLKKSRAEPKVVKLQLEIGESTTYGWRIMPDENNFGPLYLSKLSVPE